MDLTPCTVRNALNCKFLNDLIRFTPEFCDQSDWAKFGLLLARYASTMRTVSSSLYERLDPDEQLEFVKWFLLRWAQIDVLGQEEKDEYERKWESTKEYNWSVRAVEGKKHVIVDLRDLYGFQLIYDGTYRTIDQGAWILCDFLHNQYCFKNFSVEKGDVILDVGAYIGETALLFSSHAPDSDCTIHSFEISPSNYDALRKNIAYNELTNVYANRLAAYSRSNVELTFTDLRGATSLASSASQGGGRYTVNTVTIDDYVNTRSLDKVDFIKMDIEGAEMEALKGAVKTIKKFKPKLAICIYHLESDPYEIPRFISELCPEYDFRFNWYAKKNGNDAILYACVGMKPETTPPADDEMDVATIDEVVYRCLFSSHEFHEATKAEHDRQLKELVSEIRRLRTPRVARVLSLPFRASKKIRENGIRWTINRILQMVRKDDV